MNLKTLILKVHSLSKNCFPIREIKLLTTNPKITYYAKMLTSSEKTGREIKKNVTVVKTCHGVIISFIFIGWVDRSISRNALF